MDTIANSMPQAGKSMMIGSHLVTPAERTHVDNFEEEKIMDMDEFVMADEGGQVEKNVHTFLRQVKAPKGKLGVHVKMTSAGPVIDNLEPDSPMKNVFVPDDLIVAVNGVNVRKMSADEYTGKRKGCCANNRKILQAEFWLPYNPMNLFYPQISLSPRTIVNAT